MKRYTRIAHLTCEIQNSFKIKGTDFYKMRPVFSQHSFFYSPKLGVEPIEPTEKLTDIVKKLESKKC